MGNVVRFPRKHRGHKHHRPHAQPRQRDPNFDPEKQLGLTLNEGQRQAKIDIEESIRERRQHLLTGDPGTGKTAVMQIVGATVNASGKFAAMTAPTHQACAVLRRKLAAAGLHVPVITTHALLGLKPTPDGDRLKFTRDRYAEPINADVIAIDETSMIGMEMTDHINRWANGRAVIFAGDEGQLFPVGEGESPTFKVPNRSYLTEPVRQAAGNPILVTSRGIRKAQRGEEPIRWADWFKPEHGAEQGIYLPRDRDAWMKKAFTSEAFEADSYSFRYLCWTNERVGAVNRMVREWRYGPTQMPFVVGERALIREPLVQHDNIVLNTNEEVTVRAISPSNYRGLETWAMEVEDDKGLSVTAHLPQRPKDYANALRRFADEAIKGERSWGAYHAFKQALLTAQALYSLTVHNAQGLTLKTAFLDETEMRRWVRTDQAEGLRGLLVATTRPSHQLIVV